MTSVDRLKACNKSPGEVTGWVDVVFEVKLVDEINVRPGVDP